MTQLVHYNSFSNALIQSPGHLFWRDRDLIHLGCNQRVSDFHGLKHPQNIIGLTNYDLPLIEAYVELFSSTDKEVMVSRKEKKSLSFVPNRSGKLVALLATVKPLIGKNDSIEGIIGQCIELDDSLLTSVSHRICHFKQHQANSVYYLLDEEYKKHPFSKREAQCLFYLLRGKTAKQIAAILFISPKTVESHIENIKVKMDCCNKSQLIEKAIVEGYMNIIPEGVI